MLERTQLGVFMNKIIKIAMLLVALTATFSFGSYGFRAGFNLYDVSSGDSKEDDYIEMGHGFGGGLVTITPLTSKLSFVSELSFFYRKLFSEDLTKPTGHEYKIYLSEFAMSIPIMFQLTLAEGIPYLAAGVQLDSPISPKATTKENGEETSADVNGRESLDFGILLGLGYLITPNIGVDARAVIGLTPPFKRADDSRLNQYGAGLTYYF